MAWFSTFRCTHCGAPLDVDADLSACPYCYSSQPCGELAQTDAVGGNGWVFSLAILALAVIAVMGISDIWLGTTLLPTLLETFDAWVK